MGQIRQFACPVCGVEVSTSDVRKKFCTKRCADRSRNVGAGAGPVNSRVGSRAEPADFERVKDDVLIGLAEERGYTITRERVGKQRDGTRTISPAKLKGERVKIGVVSDTHLGSKWQQLSHLNSFYQYAESEGVDFFLHAGDFVDGSPKHHRDTVYNMFVHGYSKLRDYAIEVYPKASVPTYAISGNHDYSFINDNGADIVSDVCDSRPDLDYLGPIGQYMQVGNLLIYIMHPFDAGAKTLSTKPQNWITGVNSENKPHVLLMGNYHKALQLPSYRNVSGFLVPSFQGQTPFMQGKSIESVVGGIILDLGWDDEGITTQKVEWVLFKRPLDNDY